MILSKEKKGTNKWIVYSIYGLQSHIVINSLGIIFTCNVLITHEKLIDSVYNSKEDAMEVTNDFYNRIAEIKFLGELEGTAEF